VGGCRGDARAEQPVRGPLASGDHDRSREIADTARTYILHVPPQGRAGEPLPLVISLGRVPASPPHVAGELGFEVVLDRDDGTGRDLDARIEPLAFVWQTGL
jgi:poly(3-hydroxybutyrate) depolymerase